MTTLSEAGAEGGLSSRLRLAGVAASVLLWEWGVWTARCQGLTGQAPLAVYLYGEAARVASRRTLPAIRAGEYEALPEKVLYSLDGGWVWGEPQGYVPLSFPLSLPQPQRGTPSMGYNTQG